MRGLLTCLYKKTNQNQSKVQQAPKQMISTNADNNSMELEHKQIKFLLKQLLINLKPLQMHMEINSTDVRKPLLYTLIELLNNQDNVLDLKYLGDIMAPLLLLLPLELKLQLQQQHIPAQIKLELEMLPDLLNPVWITKNYPQKIIEFELEPKVIHYLPLRLIYRQLQKVLD
jgi:hypothetical protein